jgi:uncharacterized membrane protein
MSLVRCRNCDHEQDAGFMPAVTTGMVPVLSIVLAGTAAYEVFGLLKSYGHGLIIKIIGTLGTFALACVIFLLVIDFVTHGVDWLIAMRRKCPECGERKWSFPYTSGFGL